MLGRLAREDVCDLPRRLRAYDAELNRKTGLSLIQIAVRAAGVDEECANRAIASNRVAVVPVTSGEGVIEGFVEAVKETLVHMGADAFITDRSDVAGLAEGFSEKNGDIAFLADDNRFIALSRSLRKIVDNAQATAKGYVAALEAMIGDLAQRPILVIGGAGRVGWNAVLSLEGKETEVAILDPNKDKATSLTEGHDIRIVDNLEEALRQYHLIFDASPEQNIIQTRHITSETYIVAPGMPFGVTEQACALVEERLIHDVLEIGVATMLVQAVCG